MLEHGLQKMYYRINQQHQILDLVATCIHVPCAALLQFFYIDPVSSTVKWAYKYSFTKSMHLKEYKNSCEKVLGLQTLALSEAEKNVSIYSSPMSPRIRVQRQEGSRCCSTLLCTVCVGTISAGEACVFLHMFFST